MQADQVCHNQRDGWVSMRPPPCPLRRVCLCLSDARYTNLVDVMLEFYFFLFEKESVPWLVRRPRHSSLTHGLID